ncbi:MAG: STAS domain-containing protein [Leptospira sp.]|nr:STAS domain-containing protein [Leptospira sp.]
MTDFIQPKFLLESGQLKVYQFPLDELYPSLVNKAMVIKLEGEINLYSSQHIKEIIQEAVDQEVIHIFLELCDIDYIDSSGLGVFLGAHSKVHRLGGGVHLCNPSKKVNYVLTLTKLIGLMKIFPTWEEGCKSLL